ncbi:MAG: hypothetical protein VKO44_09745 [Cyanobacteriota bacterium]|nr:hypothetical protein [Cyanobacteriota bacterium]
MATVLPSILLASPVPPGRLSGARRAPRPRLSASARSAPPRRFAPRRPSGGLAAPRVAAAGAHQAAGPWAPLALAALLVAVSTLVAPEQPHAQEAICQRHSGADACLVW